MAKYLLRRRGVPALVVRYPADEAEARTMVGRIKGFLEGLK